LQQYRYCWKLLCLLGPCKGVIRRITEARIGVLKGATIWRGLELGSREIDIIRSRYQERSNEDTAGWKRA
jgi:hypothetical protein